MTKEQTSDMKTIIVARSMAIGFDEPLAPACKWTKIRWLLFGKKVILDFETFNCRRGILCLGDDASYQTLLFANNQKAVKNCILQ